MQVLAAMAASLRAPLRRVHERGTVVVTGATSGVGRDAALRLLADGFHVVAVTRQQEAAAARGLLLEGLPGATHACPHTRHTRRLASTGDAAFFPLRRAAAQAGCGLVAATGPPHAAAGLLH